MCRDENQISCYCIVPHESQPAILVQKAGERCRCPSVQLPKSRLSFFPDYVPAIRQELRRQTHLVTTVLRHLQDWADVQVCVMEVHSADDCLPPDYLWLDGSQEVLWADEHSARAWQAWSVLLMKAEDSVLAPWERSGWFAEAAFWMQARLHEAGYVLQGPIEQLKGAWSWSSLLTVETDHGRVYFKADYECPPQEAAIVLKLAERWPRNVPFLIASSEEHGWMLMSDFGGSTLEPLEVGDYLSAVVQFAQIQRSTALDLRDWRRLGCSDMTPHALLRHTQRLFADTAALCGGQDGLSREEMTLLERKRPQIELMLNRLASSALPNVISNEDFRPGNVVVRDDVCLFYDWSGTVISHPLFGINYFLNRMARTHSEDRVLWRNDVEGMRRGLASAFLSEWAEYASWDQIVAEFWLCRRLCFLYEAVRCYCDLPFVGTVSPWGAGTLSNISHALRHLLAALNYQPSSRTIAEAFDFPFRRIGRSGFVFG